MRYLRCPELRRTVNAPTHASLAVAHTRVVRHKRDVATRTSDNDRVGIPQREGVCRCERGRGHATRQRTPRAGGLKPALLAALLSSQGGAACQNEVPRLQRAALRASKTPGKASLDASAQGSRSDGGTPRRHNSDDRVSDAGGETDAAPSGENPVLDDAQFVDVRATDIGSDRATVRFDTVGETTCEVQWGTSEKDLSHHAIDPDMDPDNPFALTHRVPLEDLPPKTRVYFRAWAMSRSNETFYSSTYSFETKTAAAVESDERVNVASLDSGATVTGRSSNFGDAKDSDAWGAQMAIDGQMSTEWATGGDGDAAYLELDLGSVHRIDAVAFRSRKMSDGSSIIQSFELVFDEDETVGPFDAPDPDERYVFELARPYSTQHVRLNALKTTGGNTGIKELELLAVP